MELATIRSASQGRLGQKMEEAFPEVDWLISPLGNQVIVQLRVPKNRSSGGIIVPNEVRDYDSSVVRVAKVVAIGPIAFRQRDSMETWPEGAWVQVGDFVRVPSYAGVDSWRIATGAHEEQRGADTIIVEEFVKFASFNDYDMKGKVKGNPLDIVDYI